MQIMAIHAGGEIFYSQQMGQAEMLMFMMMVMMIMPDHNNNNNNNNNNDNNNNNRNNNNNDINNIIGNFCVCDVSLSTDLAMICPHGVMTIIRHNEIRDLTTDWMNEVCTETKTNRNFNTYLVRASFLEHQTNKKKPGWISRQKAFGVDSKEQGGYHPGICCTKAG